MPSSLRILVASVLAAAVPMSVGAHAPVRVEAPVQHAPPTPATTPLRSAPIVVIRLTGDLVAVRLVSRLREELDAAAAAKAELVVLTLEGYRWRAEVVRALADAVKASTVPVAALLGPASPVGGGQTLVALAGTTCWISVLTSIKSDAKDEVVMPAVVGASLGPEPSPAAEIVARRGLPASMAAVLLAPATPVYAAWEGSDHVLTLHDGAAPANAAGNPVSLVMIEPSGPRARISSDTAVRLGIARATARDPGEVLRALSLRASSVTTRVVSEDLAARKVELHAALAGVRTLTSQAADRLTATPRGDDPADQDKRRKAGQASLSTLQHAIVAIARAEALAKDYPELLVEAPPGTSAVGMTPEGAVKAWHAAFKDAQADLAKAAERAARAAEPKR